MVELNDNPSKAVNPSNPKEGEDAEVATGGPRDTKGNPNPRPEEAVSEENRLKMEQAAKDEAKDKQ